MLDLLKAALKGGFKTSEFWLAVVALFIPLVDGMVQRVIDFITSAQSTTHNPIYLVILTGAAAAVSAAYSIARALVKREQVRQLPTAAVLDGYAGANAVTTNPLGTPSAERARAIAAGANPSDLAP